MLRRLHIKNYKSLVNLEVTLDSLVVVFRAERCWEKQFFGRVAASLSSGDQQNPEGRFRAPLSRHASGVVHVWCQGNQGLARTGGGFFFHRGRRRVVWLGHGKGQPPNQGDETSTDFRDRKWIFRRDQEALVCPRKKSPLPDRSRDPAQVRNSKSRRRVLDRAEFRGRTDTEAKTVHGTSQGSPSLANGRTSSSHVP